jgi:ankyrin repeat protein
MASRRILNLSATVIVAAMLLLLRSDHHAYAQNTQPQLPTIYTCANLKGKALKKAVTDNPAVLTQLNPEGRNLLSLIFSYQRPSAEDVQMLLEKGSDARSTDYYGNAVLHSAASAGTPKIIELLVKAGADVNQRNQRGLTPLAMVAHGVFNDAMKENAEALLALGAHLDVTSAAALGKLPELRAMISADPDSATEEDESHYSLLERAALHHQRDVLQVIARSNPRLNMFQAAAIGDQSALKDALQKAPGSVNDSDAHGLTPLDWAVTAESESMVKFLLEHGANPNASRALVLAARNGDLEIARLLLEHGADPSDPRTKFTADQLEDVNPYKAADPYQSAINSHHPDVAELIKQARKKD